MQNVGEKMPLLLPRPTSHCKPKIFVGLTAFYSLLLLGFSFQIPSVRQHPTSRNKLLRNTNFLNNKDSKLSAQEEALRRLQTWQSLRICSSLDNLDEAGFYESIQSCVEGGYICNKVGLKWSEEKGWGMYAVADMEPFEPVIDFPTDRCISPYKVFADSVLSEAALELESKFDDHNDAAGAVLVMYILKELSEREKSPLYNYIQSMPWDTVDVASVLLWTKKEVNALAGTSVYMDVLERRNRVAQEAALIKASLPKSVAGKFKDKKELDEMIKKVFFMVNSRSFAYFLPDGVTWSAIMLPILDMFNHSPQPERRTAEYKVDYEKAEVVAGAAGARAGEELTIAYSDYHTNSNLFLYYGFIIQDDPDLWQAGIELGIDETDELYKQKMSLLERNSFYPDGKTCMLRMNDTDGNFDLGRDDYVLLKIKSMTNIKKLEEQGQDLITEALESDDFDFQDYTSRFASPAEKESGGEGTGAEVNLEEGGEFGYVDETRSTESDADDDDYDTEEDDDDEEEASRRSEDAQDLETLELTPSMEKILSGLCRATLDELKERKAEILKRIQEELPEGEATGLISVHGRRTKLTLDLIDTEIAVLESYSR